MDDFLLSLFGCVVVLGIIAVPIAVVVVIFRRFGRLEAQIAELRGQLARMGAGARPAVQPAAVPLATDLAAPIAAAPPSERPPSVETVVTVPTPAFFETKAVADPPSAPPAAAAPPADRPLSVETVVSTPLPAQFETRVSAPPAAAPGQQPSPPAAPARPAKPGRSLEETLATRLPVWIAAVAITLGAAYLVKMSIDAGIFGPGLRVTLGVVLGVVLLGAGEWLRKSSDYVAKGLSAAGIAALFVSFFAATSLYQLIPPALGFGLMALTTATAVALSLRQGYIVAVVGLLGGFLTPALTGPAASSSAVLFLYLLLLQVGLLAVSRRRDWGSLPLLALAGGLAWVFARLGGAPGAGDSLWIGLFLLLTTGGFLLGLGAVRRLGASAASSAAVAAGERPYLEAVRWLAIGGALAAMAALLAQREYGNQEWVFLGLIAGGAFVLARLDERYHGFAWLASALVTILLGAYGGRVVDHPELAGSFIATHLAFGLLIAAGAFAAHFGSRFAGRFAALSSVAGVGYLLMQYRNAELLGTAHLSWGAISLGLAVLYTLAALPAAKRRPADPAAAAPLAAFAVGATTLLSLAVPLELERQWLTVAWALEVWALMWLARRLSVGALRVCAGVLSALVAVRLLLNPEVISYPIGATPIFNWLLYGYGIPLIAFVAAARIERRSGGPSRLGEAFEWLAQAFAYALVSLEIRHFFYRDAGNLGLLAPGATDTHLVEWGTYASFWLLLVFVQIWVGARVARESPLSRPLLWGIRIAYLGLTGVTLLFTALVLNPLWSAEYVGSTPVFNWLLWIYGLPALLRFLLALRFEKSGELWLARTGYLAALLEVFLLITFEVRQAFQGARLDSGAPSTAESYAYSFAWIALAFVMAAIGVKAARKGLRYGSAIIMLVAVFKVFLFDTSNLEGIYRVLSLFGLGVALFLLAYLYRRFVFPSETEEASGAAEKSGP